MKEENIYDKENRLVRNYFINDNDNLDGIYKMWCYDFPPNIHYIEVSYKNGEVYGLQKCFFNNLLKHLGSFKDINGHGICLEFNYNESG